MTVITPRHDTAGTAPEPAGALVERLRATFRSGRTRSLAWRTGQLQALRRMLTEHGADFAAALHQDLRKSRTEAYRTEVDFTIREIDHTLEHLEDWLRPEPAPVGRAAGFAEVAADFSARFAWVSEDRDDAARPAPEAESARPLAGSCAAAGGRCCTGITDVRTA